MKSKIKEPITTKKFRETKCQRCKRVFYRKLVPSKGNGRELTKINDVTYWADGK
ncbi:5246_t:CDS:1, partial [Racocetra persica]